MAQAVIFDLDGCLVDSEPLSLEAIASQMRFLGIGDANAEEIGEKFLGIGINVICDYVAERLGSDCPSNFQRDVETRLFASYRERLNHIDGTTRMLDDLKSKGIGLGLATGGSMARMKVTLEISELAMHFEGTACSVDEVARGKPAPDLFLLAAQRLGVKPENCMVLEDSPHGVLGAVRAGMQVIGFVGGSHLRKRRSKHSEILLKAGAAKVCVTLNDATRIFLKDAAWVFQK